MSIELKKVNYTYSQRTPFAQQSLNQLDLIVHDGQWLVVMGPTGSGKSTLLQHLNGLIKPDSGEVLIDGINIHSSLECLTAARQKVGLVFQYPEHQLFGSTVYEDIAYGPENFGYKPDSIEDAVRKGMAMVGLDFERYKNRLPNSLSGGEKRRVALAGVLAISPQVIALDEPTAGLDRTGKTMLVEAISHLNRVQGVTVIWVTHEISDIVGLADRLLVLNNGKAMLDGPIRQAIMNPLLQELGLDTPLAVEIINHLKKKGKEPQGMPVTIDEIKQEIIGLVR